MGHHGNSFTSFPAVGGPVGGWVELGRTTLGSNNDQINVSSLSDKRYYMVLTSIQNNGQIIAGIRLNGDTGTNYAFINSTNGASDTPNTGVTHLSGLTLGTTTVNIFQLAYWANLSAEEKLSIAHTNLVQTTGAGTAPVRFEQYQKWANTSNPISAFLAQDFGSGNFATGSEVVVLEWDPADTHTTNFWEELASVSSTSTINSIESGTFTSKKYLWVQGWINTTVAANWGMRLGNATIDSDNNYAPRYSINGASDVPQTSQTIGFFDASGGGVVGPMFMNAFIVNISSEEKLVIWNAVWGDTAGAANAPNRSEGVFKWVNTSNQANILSIGTFNQNFTESELRVYGAN